MAAPAVMARPVEMAALAEAPVAIAPMLAARAAAMEKQAAARVTLAKAKEQPQENLEKPQASYIPAAVAAEAAKTIPHITAQAEAAAVVAPVRAPKVEMARRTPAAVAVEEHIATIVVVLVAPVS
jgi:hypothetical protein